MPGRDLFSFLTGLAIGGAALGNASREEMHLPDSPEPTSPVEAWGSPRVILGWIAGVYAVIFATLVGAYAVFLAGLAVYILVHYLFFSDHREPAVYLIVPGLAVLSYLCAWTCRKLFHFIGSPRRFSRALAAAVEAFREPDPGEKPKPSRSGSELD